MQTTIRKPKPAFNFCGDRVVFLGLLAFSLVFTARLHAQANPLQIRIFNNSGTNASMVCLYNNSGSSIKYTPSAGGPEVTKAAYASWPLSDIQTATDTLGRTYYPIQYVSGAGRIYFGLGTNSYPDSTQPAATGGCKNPFYSQPGTPWNGAVDDSGNVTAPAINFDYLEIGYDGKAADQIDVSAINSQGLAMMFQLCQAANIPVSPQSAYRKGFTNTNAISTMNAGFKAVPAAPWYGGAANTSLVRFVGPSSSTSPGIILPPGGGNNPANGWPGATNNSFAPYLYMISTSPALGIINGNKYWAVITNTVPLKNNSSQAVHFTYSGYWTLVNNSAPNPTSAQLTWLRGQAGGTNYYYTKTPVLTNITILASNTVTGVTNTYSNLAIRYNPDAGTAAQSVFSSYIYLAPSYTTGGSDPYITLFPSEASWSTIATAFNFSFGGGGSSDFAANVLQAIANDIAFGLAGGFVLSPVQGYAQWTDQNGVLTPPGISPALPLTPVTGSLTNIGKMGSQSWWLQTNLYAQLQPGSPAANPWYSQWGSVVFNATTTAYAHPIQDRMVQSSVQPQMDPSPAFTDPSYFMELYLNNAVNPAAPAPGQPPVIESPTGSVNLNNTAQGVFWQVQVVASQSPTSYDASNLPNGVQLNPATGLIQGTIPANTFYKNLNIQLWAVNANGVGAKSTLLLTVNPPTPPGPTAPVITSETSATATQKASFTYRITASGSPTSYGATALPAGLKVNTKNGVISGKATAAPGLYKVTLSARNRSGVGTETLDLTVASGGGAPAITSAEQASGEVDVYFEYQIEASGNPTSYGATGLPAGITVNSRTGKISGETSRPGKYRVELSASNAQGIGRQILYLTVDPKPQPGVDITSSLATVTIQVGVLYSYTITADNSPTSYGARGLPPGLRINTRTGVISGRPSKGGDYSVTLTATHKVRGERTTVAQGTKVFLIRPFGNKTIPDNAW